MSPELISLVDADTPKLNPVIANGLAATQLKEAEKHIDEVFKLVSREFPPGLVYQGYARCTPMEEFNERTRRRENRQTYEIARTDFYMVKFFFTYHGEPLFKTPNSIGTPAAHMYLPFCGDAGMLSISGSKFAISPVLNDRVISIGVDDVFIRLMRGKVTFQRLTHTVIRDGRKETGQVIWGMIYNRTDKQKIFRSTTKANSSMVHYLFCKYGVTETFRRFAGTEVVVCETQIDSASFPAEDWVICNSAQLKPKGVYAVSTLSIAIPRAKFNNIAKSLVDGFFYIADHFPMQVQAHYIDNTTMWLVLLGNILQSGDISPAILKDEMEAHLVSLDEYLDRPIAEELRDIGIHVNDFYELMVVVVDNFNQWILESSDKISSMYDKELNVLYHLLSDITFAIFKMNFKLRAAASNLREGRTEMSIKEIEKIFKDHLKPGLIYEISKSHREVTSISYSGDNKVFKITSLLIPQAELARGGGGKKAKAGLSDPGKRLHVSVAEVGGHLNIPKAEPSGRGRINGFLRISGRGVIQRAGDFEDQLNDVQKAISL